MEETNYLLNIDVLGFGNFVKNNDIKKVTYFYNRIITGSAFSGEIIDKSNIEIMVYSDTIAIKSNNENKDKRLLDLIQIAKLIQTSQYYAGVEENLFLPIRGTITYGEYVFHKGDISTVGNGRMIEAKDINLIFGKPIVESYYLEKDMEIIAIALGDSVIQKDNILINYLVKENLLCKYNIPLKEKEEHTRKNKKNLKSGYLIPFDFVPNFEENMKTLENSKEKNLNDKSIKDKYINTMQFLKYINESIVIPRYNKLINQ